MANAPSSTSTPPAAETDGTTAGAPRSTESRIVEAATALFYEKGYHATTMREIAADVGIKAGSLYNHFASKQEILHRIAAATLEELLAGGHQALEASEEPRDRLLAFVRAHVVYHAERRYQARVADEQLHALDATRLRAVVAIRDEYEQLLKDILEAGREEHGWHVPDVAVIAFAISTMCTSVDTWYRETGRLTPEDVAGLYGTFVLAALEGGDGRRS
jgi:AcrR family transcriptional regulator